MKLGLGTVQWGTDYGVSNRAGKTPRSEVAAILEKAAARGVSMLDTAPAYGESEFLLGELARPEQGFKIITKTPPIPGPRIESEDADALQESFAGSLRRLRRDSLEGLLVHHGADLLKPGSDRLWQSMRRLKEGGIVRCLGVSVHSPQEIDVLMSRYDLDMIQVPINLFDQRLIEGGHIERLKRQGLLICGRSVFLQGLLLMQPDELPQHLGPCRDHLRKYHAFLQRHSLSALQASLRFVMGRGELDFVFVGVCSARELEEIMVSLAQPAADMPDWQALASRDPQLIDPLEWLKLSA